MKIILHKENLKEIKETLIAIKEKNKQLFEGSSLKEFLDAIPEMEAEIKKDNRRYNIELAEDLAKIFIDMIPSCDPNYPIKDDEDDEIEEKLKDTTVQMTYRLWKQTRGFFIGIIKGLKEEGLKDELELFNDLVEKLDNAFNKEENKGAGIKFNLPNLVAKRLFEQYPDCEYKDEEGFRERVVLDELKQQMVDETGFDLADLVGKNNSEKYEDIFEDEEDTEDDIEEDDDSGLVSILADSSNWKWVKPFFRGQFGQENQQECEEIVKNYEEAIARGETVEVQFTETMGNRARHMLRDMGKLIDEEEPSNDWKEATIKEIANSWMTAKKQGKDISLFNIMIAIEDDPEFSNAFSAQSGRQDWSEEEQRELYKDIFFYDKFEDFLEHMENEGNGDFKLVKTLTNIANSDEVKSLNDSRDIIKVVLERMDPIFKFTNRKDCYGWAIRAVKEYGDGVLGDSVIWTGEWGFFDKYCGTKEDFEKDWISNLKDKWAFNIYDFYWKAGQTFNINFNKYSGFFRYFVMKIKKELVKTNDEWLNDFSTREQEFYEDISDIGKSQRWYIENDKAFLMGEELNKEDTIYFNNLLMRYYCGYEQFLEMVNNFRQQPKGSNDYALQYPPSYKLNEDLQKAVSAKFEGLGDWADYYGIDGDYHPLAVVENLQGYAYLFGYKGTLVFEICEELLKQQGKDGATIAKAMKDRFDSKVYGGIEYALRVAIALTDKVNKCYEEMGSGLKGGSYNPADITRYMNGLLWEACWNATKLVSRDSFIDKAPLLQFGVKKQDVVVDELPVIGIIPDKKEEDLSVEAPLEIKNLDKKTIEFNKKVIAFIDKLVDKKIYTQEEKGIILGKLFTGEDIWDAFEIEKALEKWDGINSDKKDYQMEYNWLEDEWCHLDEEEPQPKVVKSYDLKYPLDIFNKPRYDYEDILSMDQFKLKDALTSIKSNYKGIVECYIKDGALTVREEARPIFKDIIEKTKILECAVAFDNKYKNNISAYAMRDIWFKEITDSNDWDYKIQKLDDIYYKITGDRPEEILKLKPQSSKESKPITDMSEENLNGILSQYAELDKYKQRVDDDIIVFNNLDDLLNRYKVKDKESIKNNRLKCILFANTNYYLNFCNVKDFDDHPLIKINKKEYQKYKGFFTVIKAALLYELTRPDDLFKQRCQNDDLDRIETNYLGRAQTLFALLASEGLLNENTNKTDGSDLFTFQLDKELNPEGADLFWTITDSFRDNEQQMIEKAEMISENNRRMKEQMQKALKEKMS